MISTKRMKADLIGQSVLISGLAACGFSNFFGLWHFSLLSVLGIWQSASALQLAIAHEYRERYPFLWLFLGFLLALPAGIWLMGKWVVLPISLGMAAYFLVTAKDTIYVLHRPRSFWDL